MKNLARITCAAMLGLSLVACGGGGTQKSADQTTEKPAATTDAASFEGTWKLAAVELDGVTVTGDFSNQFGVPEGNSITIDAGGTGAIVTGDEKVDLTWTSSGETTISISDEYDPADTTATLEDDTLILTSATKTDSTMVYTKDGVYPQKPEFDFEGIAIDSADGLMGAWDFCALRNTDYGDFLAWGDAEPLAKWGGLPGSQLVFDDGGKGTLLGHDMEWSLSESGVVIVVKDSNQPAKVTKDADGRIICSSDVDGAIYIFKQG